MVLCKEALLAGLTLLPGCWRPAPLQPSWCASSGLKPLWYQFTAERSKKPPLAMHNPSSLALV